MSTERSALNRLEILRALRVSNREAVFSTVHATLTGGAFQTGYALWLGASSFWMGVLASFPTFAGLIQVFSSYVVERRGERKWFTAYLSGTGRLLWLPILLIPFLLPTGLRFSAFLVLFLLSNLLLSAAMPAFNSWLSDLVPADHRGRYFGQRNMLAGLTTMLVSLPAAGFLDLAVKQRRFSEAVGFGVLFGIAVLFGLLSFLTLTRQPEPPMARPAQEERNVSIFASLATPFTEPNFRRLMIFSSLFAFAQFFAGPFYIVYALERLKLDYVWIQVLGTLSSLASLLSMPLWGYLSDKFGNRPLLAIAAFGVGILPIQWAFTSREHLVGTLVILSVNHLLGGLFWAGVGLTQFNLLIAVTPAERKSVYVAAMSAATGLAGGLAPILGGATLTALHSVQIAPLGWAMGSYQVLFLMNAALRFLALFSLRGVPTSGETTAREVLTQLGTARVGGWVQMRRLQRAQSERERRRAAQALRSARMGLAVEELITALDDPSLHVREEAAVALGEIADPRAVDALIARLDDPASGIVDEAAEALGRIGDARAVEPLAHLLQTGAKPDRVQAARALGRIGSPEAVPALLRVLEEGREAGLEVAEACASALGAIGDPAATPALIACLRQAPRDLCLTAVRALGDIGDPQAAGPLLRLLAEEQDPAVIAHIAVALAMCDAHDAVRPLLDSLERTPSPVARKQILNAAGALLDEGESFYPLLALESYARDEAVARMLREMARASRPRRRRPDARHSASDILEGVLDHYLAGAFGPAVEALARLVPPPSDGAPADPAAEALAWAVETAGRRALEPEEFLLALFAARRLSSRRDGER